MDARKRNHTEILELKGQELRWKKVSRCAHVLGRCETAEASVNRKMDR